MLAALWSNDLFFIFLRFSVSLYNWTIQKRICRVLSPTGLIKNSWSFAVGFVIRGGKSWSLWKCWPKLPKCLCRLDQRAGSVRPGREVGASPHIWVCIFFLDIIIVKYLLIYHRYYHFYYLFVALSVAFSSVLNFFVVKKITMSNINIIITLNKYSLNVKYKNNSFLQKCVCVPSKKS